MTYETPEKIQEQWTSEKERTFAQMMCYAWYLQVEYKNPVGKNKARSCLRKILFAAELIGVDQTQIENVTIKQIATIKNIIITDDDFSERAHQAVLQLMKFIYTLNNHRIMNLNIIDVASET